MQGQSGVPEYGIHGVALLEQGGANADAALVIQGFQIQRQGHAGLQAVAQFPGECGSVLRVISQILHQDQKLVTPMVSHGIAIAHHAAQPCRQQHQQAVTRVLAFHGVELAKTVHVDKEHRTQQAAAHAGQQRLGQAVLQQAAVGQAGERVVVGQAVEGRVHIAHLVQPIDLPGRDTDCSSHLNLPTAASGKPPAPHSPARRGWRAHSGARAGLRQRTRPA